VPAAAARQRLLRLLAGGGGSAGRGSTTLTAAWHGETRGVARRPVTDQIRRRRLPPLLLLRLQQRSAHCRIVYKLSTTNLTNKKLLFTCRFDR